MARLMVIYRTPDDPEAFDKYYSETHIPLAKKMPGLRKFEVNDGPLVSPAGDSGLHLIATLHFDDMEALQAALGSPEGQAAAADVANFAPADDAATLLIYDSREA